jgi:hypothetical protein
VSTPQFVGILAWKWQMSGKHVEQGNAKTVNITRGINQTLFPPFWR